MSEQFPPSDEPTRMGPPQGQDVPPTAPGSWPAPQPTQPPAQAPGWAPPQPSPYGDPYGQPPAGDPYGQPPAGGPSWGAPAPQPGYGGPGGPGGPGYGGPGGPGGPQGPWDQGPTPPGGGGRKGLIIGAVVLTLALVGGGIAAAVALSGDDGDDDAKGKDDTSQAAQPTESTAAPTESTTAAPTFEAANFDEVSRVCQGEAMSNAAAWDPASPVGMPFMTPYAGSSGWGFMPGASTKSWNLSDYGAFETVNFVVCVEGTPAAAASPQQCTTDGESYEWTPLDYAVTIREAATSEVLKEFEADPETSTGCPSFAAVRDGKASTLPDTDAITGSVDAWLVEAGAGGSGDGSDDGTGDSGDTGTGGASFEATSYFDLPRVCMGGAATNLPAFDAASAKGIGALTSPKEPNYGGNLTVGLNEKWGIDVPQWAKTSFVVCAEGTPSASVKPRKCKASQEKKKGPFMLVQYDYALTVREASTGKVLTELETLKPEFDTCPMFAFIDESGEYTPTPDTREIDDRVNAWLAKEAGKK
ncbi:hypothetical protein [Nocardioides daejeonensis]|uniref:hypothetical protein n=1 Tax=Nocardioides daejeonensis TaxID=1046556 RepID=UPI0013A59D83|nr:hypothetical protein [Nocardioides daejeonensis]